MAVRFYIFRHGESTYNVLGKTQGHTDDSVLTDKGREQALTVGRKLKDKDIEVIVTSPLKRAKETAEIANSLIGSEIVVDKTFIEVNVGEVEGWDFEQIQAVYGELYDKWRSNDEKYCDICFKGGESKKEVRERIIHGLKKYGNQHYKTVAISGHGITIYQLLLALGYNHTNIPNGSIAAFDYDNGKLTFLGFE